MSEDVEEIGDVIKKRQKRDEISSMSESVAESSDEEVKEV